MEDLILLDTSVLIDFFRKKNSQESFFYHLSGINIGFCISVVTHFEISNGINLRQESFWSNFFSDILIIPYNISLNFIAVGIIQQLKRKRKSIEFKDIIISSTAINFGYQLATLNKKHFRDISELKLLTPDSFE